MNTITILLLTCILSVTGLFVFIWSLRKNLFDDNPAAANVIFTEGEIGKVEEHAATQAQYSALQHAGAASQTPVRNQEHEARIKAELAARVLADGSSEEHGEGKRGVGTCK